MPEEEKTGLSFLEDLQNLFPDIVRHRSIPNILPSPRQCNRESILRGLFFPGVRFHEIVQ